MGRRSGTTAVQQNPLSVRKDDAGVSTTVPYVTSDAQNLSTLLAAYDADTNISYDYREQFGGGARIDLTYSYDFTGSTPQTYVQPLWEFFAQKVEKDLLVANLPIGTGATYNVNGDMISAGTFPSFGNNIEGIGSITAQDSQLIRIAGQQAAQGIKITRDWFNSPKNTAIPPAALTDPEGNTVDPAINTAGCYTIFLLNQRGQTSSIVFAPVLRFTQTVTSQYAIQASLLNAGQIISSATMPILENIPSGLLFNLPNDPNPASQKILLAGDLVWGWFKDFPTIRQIARLKWNIVQEWQYGLWPVAVYGELL